MYFSKSFGYAVRGVLYVALTSNDKKTQLEEIAIKLAVPRYFLGKIMKKLVKGGILISAKGPNGGFCINTGTLSTSLMDIALLIDGKNRFNQCVLHFRVCNAERPCPLHKKMENYRKGIDAIITDTTIGDIIAGNKSDLILAISNSVDKDQCA